MFTDLCKFPEIMLVTTVISAYHYLSIYELLTKVLYDLHNNTTN